MKTSPYSIYVKGRPLRTAFLVEDSPKSLLAIEHILSYCRNCWGGRYSPLLLSDGQTISDESWAILEAADPDVVKSVPEISDELILALDRRIAPYLIEQCETPGRDAGHRSLFLNERGLSVLPTAHNVRSARWGFNEPELVLFETDAKTTDPIVKRFVEWNFGAYSLPDIAVTRALTGVLATRFAATDAASLATHLEELSKATRYVYPIQLCSLPRDASPDVKHDPNEETFHVIVGDSAADISMFWNRPAAIPEWCRVHLKQLWLPPSIARDARVVDALRMWLKNMVMMCSHGGRDVRFLSMSLSRVDLDQAVAPLIEGLGMACRVDVLPRPMVPVIKDRPLWTQSHEEADLFRAIGVHESLTLREPDQPTGPIRPECWMADLHIESPAERLETIGGQRLWWQLPRHAGLAVRMFKRPARILTTRIPSVRMQMGTPRLDLSLPTELGVFVQLGISPDVPYFTADARSKRKLQKRRPFREMRRSDKGRYLSGLLELFGGLYGAHSTLTEHYWRVVFDAMSGGRAEGDALHLGETQNTLRKRLGRNRPDFYKSEDSVKWLSQLVLKLARRLPAGGGAVGFDLFERVAKRECDDYSARHPEASPHEVSREDLLDGIADLTARNIILIGIEARCAECGYRAWHHINSIQQVLRCSGCNADIPMRPEMPWRYQLNSLVRAALAEHGLMAVTLVLGQLEMEARSAFMYAPCLDVMEDESGNLFGDIDVAVIQDGRFIIGEVKQSRDLYDVAVFSKMEEVARRLLPDEVIFSSMDREPTQLIAAQIAKLSAALEPEHMRVRWYPLQGYLFEAFPPR